MSVTLTEWTWMGVDLHGTFWIVDETFGGRKAAERWATEPGHTWVHRDGGYLAWRTVTDWARA